jgi:hypothetical protein
MRTDHGYCIQLDKQGIPSLEECDAQVQESFQLGMTF